MNNELSLLESSKFLHKVVSFDCLLQLNVKKKNESKVECIIQREAELKDLENSQPGSTPKSCLREEYRGSSQPAI